MQLTSSVFANNQTIPFEFTGEGRDLSPPLAWTNVPDGTLGFALICEDPDAPRTPLRPGPFVHWLLYNLQGHVRALPRDLPRRGFLDQPVTAAQGTNSFGNTSWNGPMPPVGHGTHHYEFTLYALDKALYLPTGLSRDELEARLKGRILNTAKLTGLYERKSLVEREAG